MFPANNWVIVSRSSSPDDSASGRWNAAMPCTVGQLLAVYICSTKYPNWSNCQRIMKLLSEITSTEHAGSPRTSFPCRTKKLVQMSWRCLKDCNSPAKFSFSYELSVINVSFLAGPDPQTRELGLDPPPGSLRSLRQSLALAARVVARRQNS